MKKTRNHAIVKSLGNFVLFLVLSQKAKLLLIESGLSSLMHEYVCESEFL